MSNISDYLAKIGSKGGKTVTPKKIAALRRNLEKANARKAELARIASAGKSGRSKQNAS